MLLILIFPEKEKRIKKLCAKTCYKTYFIMIKITGRNLILHANLIIDLNDEE